MNKKLVCIVAVFQFICVSASSFSPSKSPSKHTFSPYSPISYLAPSPNSVAQFSPTRKTVLSAFSPVKRVVSPQRSKITVSSKPQVKYNDGFIENLSERRNIDAFIALALKHEESLLRHSEKTNRIQDGKIDFRYFG